MSKKQHRRHRKHPVKDRGRRSYLQRHAPVGFQGYPVATVSYYGPDNRFASKVAVGIILKEGGEAVALERWFSTGGDVRSDPDINRAIVKFFREHRVKSVLMVDRIIGCPHEEGKDYPRGQSCPKCPYWANRDRRTGELLEEEAEDVELVMACAWYRKDQWDRLLEISVDSELLGESYEAWAESAEASMRKLALDLEPLGLHLKKVVVDVEALLAWCQAEGREVNGEARAAYAGTLVQEGGMDGEADGAEGL